MNSLRAPLPFLASDFVCKPAEITFPRRSNHALLLHSATSIQRQPTDGSGGEPGSM